MRNYEINIFKGGDGRLFAHITYNNKRYTVSGKSKKEIFSKIDKKYSELEKGTISADETLASYVVKWFNAEKQGKVSYSVEQRYRSLINNYIIPAIGFKKLRDVKQFDIQSLVNQMQFKSNDYQSKLIETLKQVFDSAYINGLVALNPVIRIQKCGTKTKEKEALTIEEAKIILNADMNVRAKMFVHLAYYCGLRKGEIFALTWKDINFRDGYVSITKSLSFESNSGFVKEPKSKAGIRCVPMPKILSDFLKVNKKKDGLVITDSYGHQITKSSSRRLWMNVLKAIQRPKNEKITSINEQDLKANCLFEVTPHILRHTYCTNLYHAGVDLQTASKLMGHSSIEITAKIYTHIDKSYLVNSKAKIESFSIFSTDQKLKIVK